LENPTYVLDYYGNPKASAWMVESMFRLVGTQLPNRAKAVSSDSNICGVRPVITVLTSDIEY
jgi:hypothetical protein